MLFIRIRMIQITWAAEHCGLCLLFADAFTYVRARARARDVTHARAVHDDTVRTIPSLLLQSNLHLIQSSIQRKALCRHIV